MPNTHGLSTLTFGVPTRSGYVVQSYGTSATNGVAVEVFDETGVRKAVRYDDITTELTLDAILISTTTPPNPGEAFAFNGVTYEVISVEVKAANKDFVKITIKGKKSSAITPA